ncbi:MAG: hypothetical protein KZQ63_17135 [Candidatus Thiodiazotropha sp. (ex Lucinoma aequizonata)]|nr:hypothetical protein [Candidatus Thiodiazotropha sp. (ex Lucinoma aequizonata)]
MRSLYALHLSLSVAIPAIQSRLRLSGTKLLRSAFHGGQRWMWCGDERTVLVPSYSSKYRSPEQWGLP